GVGRVARRNDFPRCNADGVVLSLPIAQPITGFEREVDSVLGERTVNALRNPLARRGIGLGKDVKHPRAAVFERQITRSPCTAFALDANALFELPVERV